MHRIVSEKNVNHSVANDTLLHQITRTSLSYENFILDIKKISLEEQISSSLTVNNKGELPLDVINKNLPAADHKKIFSTLLEIALKQKTKPLHEPIDLQEILNRYNNPEPTSPLYSRLKSACKLVNATREHAASKISTTHPDINGLPIKNYIPLKIELSASRNECSEKLKETLLNHASFFALENDKFNIRAGISSSTNKILYKAQADFYNIKITNCHELAIFSFHLGEKKGLDMVIYHYEIGDHSFPAIRYKDDDIKNSIICDPWSGLVCLGSEYETQLGDHKSFAHKNKLYNLIVKFNPHYNKIATRLYYSQNIYKYDIGYSFPLKDTFVDNFISKLLPNCTPADQYLFVFIIRERLKKCMEEGLIDKEEIKAWKDPCYMLKKYFAKEDHYLPLIHHLYHEDNDIYKRKILKALEQHQVNPNKTWSGGITVLYKAVWSNNAGIVEILLKYGANPNMYIISDKSTPLFVSAQNNNLEIMKLLLNRPEIIIQPIKQNAKNYRKFVKSKNDLTRQAMAAHIENKIKQGEDSTEISMTPFEVAIIMGNAEAARMLKDFESKNSIQVSKTGLFRLHPSPCVGYEADMEIEIESEKKLENTL